MDAAAVSSITAEEPVVADVLQVFHLLTHSLQSERLSFAEADVAKLIWTNGAALHRTLAIRAQATRLSVAQRHVLGHVGIQEKHYSVLLAESPAVPVKNSANSVIVSPVSALAALTVAEDVAVAAVETAVVVAADQSRHPDAVVDATGVVDAIAAVAARMS